MSDKRINRDLLAEATHRELGHYALILDLDYEQLVQNDTFVTWATRCGADIRPAIEGGAVVKKGESEGGFMFIPSDQYEIIEKQLSEILDGVFNA
jgi:hypothetical protein